MMRRSTPPATRKAARLMPRARKSSAPTSAKKARMTKAAAEARHAIWRRFSGESSTVIARKKGTLANGSTTTKTAESETRLKLTISPSMPPGRAP
jgi:hypothetical protein